MIKNPIAKNGQIKYFELLKIAVVILSFFAWVSYLVESAHTLNNILSTIFTTELILSIITITLLINELHTIISLIKSMKIRIKSYKINQKTITVLNEIYTVITSYTKTIFIELQVLRC